MAEQPGGFGLRAAAETAADARQADERAALLREQLRRAAEDGERLYRLRMYGDEEDWALADDHRLHGILTRELTDALAALDELVAALEAERQRADEWMQPFDGSGIEWHEGLPSPYAYQASDFAKLVAAVHEYEAALLAARESLHRCRTDFHAKTLALLAERDDARRQLAEARAAIAAASVLCQGPLRLMLPIYHEQIANDDAAYWRAQEQFDELRVALAALTETPPAGPWVAVSVSEAAEQPDVEP